MRLDERDRAARLERILALRTFRGFEQMSFEQVAAVAEHTSERCYPAGTEIYPEGRPVKTLNYILSGRVEVRRGGALISTFAGKSVVGALASLAGISDGQQVIAAEDTRALEMHSIDMMDVFEDNFDMLLVVLRRVAEDFIAARRLCGESAGFGEAGGPGELPTEPLDVVDRIRRLAATTAFAGARIEVLARLARECREQVYQRGDVLWSPGEGSGRVILVVAGLVSGVTEDGAQRFRFGPDDLVGALDSMAGVPRWYTATADTEVATLEYDMEALYDVLEDHGDMALAALSSLAATVLRLRETIATGHGPGEQEDGVS